VITARPRRFDVTVNGVAATVAADGTYYGDISGGQPAGSGRPLCGQRRDHGCGGQHRDATPDPDPRPRHHGAITGVEGGDNTINAAEAADGIVITGTAEAGSTVSVNGVPATVAANGTYTATLPAPTRGRPAHCHGDSTDAARQHRD
jgi:hypothetical protein